MKSSTNQWAKKSNAVASKFLDFCGPAQNMEEKQGKELDLRADVELQFLILVKQDIPKQTKTSVTCFYHFIKERTF